VTIHSRPRKGRHVFTMPFAPHSHDTQIEMMNEDSIGSSGGIAMDKRHRGAM
jgi:hypothetical protein